MDALFSRIGKLNKRTDCLTTWQFYKCNSFMNHFSSLCLFNCLWQRKQRGMTSSSRDAVPVISITTALYLHIILIKPLTFYSFSPHKNWFVCFDIIQTVMVHIICQPYAPLHLWYHQTPHQSQGAWLRSCDTGNESGSLCTQPGLTFKAAAEQKTYLRGGEVAASSC